MIDVIKKRLFQFSIKKPLLFLFASPPLQVVIVSGMNRFLVCIAISIFVCWIENNLKFILCYPIHVMFLTKIIINAFIAL